MYIARAACGALWSHGVRTTIVRLIWRGLLCFVDALKCTRVVKCVMVMCGELRERRCDFGVGCWRRKFRVVSLRVVWLRVARTEVHEERIILVSLAWAGNGGVFFLLFFERLVM